MVGLGNKCFFVLARILTSMLPVLFSTSDPGRVQVSKATMEELTAFGYGSWGQPRGRHDGSVEEEETFWLVMREPTPTITPPTNDNTAAFPGHQVDSRLDTVSVSEPQPPLQASTGPPLSNANHPSVDRGDDDDDRNANRDGTL